MIPTMLYRYRVHYGRVDRLFTDIREAAKHILNVYDNLSRPDRESLCILEARYACKENLEKHFTLDEQYIWSIWFHGKDALNELAYPDKIDDNANGPVHGIVNEGEPLTYKEYVQKCIRRMEEERTHGSWT